MLRQTTELSVARQSEALRLRTAGYTVPQIAETMRLSVPTAYQYLQAALDNCAKETEENARRFRALELNRLDAVIKGHFDAATGADGEAPDVHAGALVIKAVAERAKLLGLYLQLDSADRTIAIADLQAMLAERQREAAERVKAAGLTIELPFAPTAAPPPTNGTAAGDDTDDTGDDAP
jgi:hypothetical protein